MIEVIYLELNIKLNFSIIYKVIKTNYYSQRVVSVTKYFKQLHNNPLLELLRTRCLHLVRCGLLVDNIKSPRAQTIIFDSLLHTIEDLLNDFGGYLLMNTSYISIFLLSR